MTDDDIDKKLDQLREEESQGNRLEKDSPANQPDFVDTLEASLQAADDGELSENLTAYDPKLVATLDALDQEGKMESVFEDLQAAYDGNAGLDEASNSAVVKLAVRVGLQEASGEVLEDLRTAIERRETTTV